MKLLCENQISYALAYVLSHGGSSAWVLNLKRKIQDMGLSRCRDRLMCLAMSSQDLKHAIKWKVLYVSQDIFDKAWEDTRLTETKTHAASLYGAQALEHPS
jgi:hypothetical protein